MKRMKWLFLALVLAAVPAVVGAGGWKIVTLPKSAWIVNESLDTDSTQIAVAFLASDTSAWINLSRYDFPVHSVASVPILMGWLDYQGSSGDSMQVTVQYSPDGADIASLSVLNVTGASPQSIPLVDYDTEANEAAIGAGMVRIIFKHNDGTAQATRLVDFRPVVLADAESAR